ncbi:hypothetical protein AS026_02755 [Rhizobium altiplani]|uniref:Uncharacterized protein n=2 Tax=Rhizobium altiplani TaxID=1864509 RepID=A0A109JRU0_9HYPH|nr:hypothetical protein AS026_02755 [Rhizobium altiplani]
MRRRQNGSGKRQSKCGLLVHVGPALDQNFCCIGMAATHRDNERRGSFVLFLNVCSSIEQCRERDQITDLGDIGVRPPEFEPVVAALL